MQAKVRKEQKFKKRLQKVLESENLQLQRELIQRISAELDLTMLDCAAALVYLSQPNLYQSIGKAAARSDTDLEIPLTAPKNRTVRYRLDIGHKHQVRLDDIKNILVAESGVERKRIGRVDIRHHYTIVELPEGMPADIFQLLAEVEIRQQKLKIKRLRPQRKFRQPRKQEH
ncbi:DbpA RNA binding domain-containing protein [Methylomarinum sp. Ch1-1]|uniref:DbpA RNA binding domain-containing protein n=1 Tax=Methylomarinum roseum TaxID=3067653 RepID=A0AAU7NT74_9GAMM|nr:DbpA RNA binding domain-containing protein [Methylomarinum sp. Ch1-1]MDP4519885.1 DbpA RNA binding domain-containing protein [Methylomarinum sp. Ch1-1]